MTVPTSNDLLAGVSDAVDALRRGQMVIVVDDADRENEGDFVLAADFVSPQAVNFMATQGRGLICVPMLTERLDALDIPPAVANNTDSHQTAFRVSVDHARLTTTGISAKDRAHTIRALADPNSKPTDFTRPGHVFPLGYRHGGVLRRPGHTEAAVDLTVLAGLTPAGVICEICSADGEMARLPELMEIGRRHGLPVLRIADLVAYRQRELSRVTRVTEARLPLAAGVFRAIGFVDGGGREHIALVKGQADSGPVPLVSVYAENLVGDVFGLGRVGLESMLQRIADNGNGALIYLRTAKSAAVSLSTCVPPSPAYDECIAQEILADLGIRHFRRIAITTLGKHTEHPQSA
ncbi:3,4-dihydroxy-2-butanone-4-phosphate synthase [Mycobacterium sp. CVI_P3]|uniref:3,4-dihydroxy-2-butanone 4-phosphate synthase n=1 Tax=Mycobacterium pinniadriaticum TaxID=2994102 RepID=A0ABT3SN82_9MYCO|nr:3,4-dihydroxy-2-butanone-4-phosphate synthase [Mycobacterium pinniadriaticum]MCX2934556.1 3,4-dihydroxy-2-butanone-4-phosphate synthase [Mycobacterium pinniadriaticum]MCX2940979.1 3,4-dihydroxy-2-butanone-4-phosphate synthase [Mycobacterium pinniadriaticum]